MNLTLLVLALAVGDGGDSAAAYTFTGGKDRTELERSPWQIVGLIYQGNETPAEQLKRQDMRMTFKGETLAFDAGKGEKRGTYQVKINPNASPRQLEWTLPTAGSPNGIYRLENGTLTIALSARGKDRPTSFSDAGIEMVLILKRVQP
jgi:uncharacterized protein (TIGR03067 family)